MSEHGHFGVPHGECDQIQRARVRAQVNSIAHGELRDDDAPWIPLVFSARPLFQLLDSRWFKPPVASQLSFLSFSPRFIRLIRLRTDMAHVWASPFPCCLWVKVGMTTIICSPGTMQLLLLSCRRAKKGSRVLGPALRHRCCHTYNIQLIVHAHTHTCTYNIYLYDIGICNSYIYIYTCICIIYIYYIYICIYYKLSFRH